MFLPFMLLSFRPRLTSSTNPIRENELTEYIKQLIVILDEEHRNENITTHEYNDYLGLINLAAERIFDSQQDLKEEVHNVTKSVLILPSDLYHAADQVKQLQEELKETKSVLTQKETAIAEKDAIIADLQKQLLEKK